MNFRINNIDVQIELIPNQIIYTTRVSQRIKETRPEPHTLAPLATFHNRAGRKIYTDPDAAYYRLRIFTSGWMWSARLIPFSQQWAVYRAVDLSNSRGARFDKDVCTWYIYKRVYAWV